MTKLQFEQVFRLLDKDGSGYMEPIEMLDLIQAYETWLYEKEFQHAMEAIYTEKQPNLNAKDKADKERDEEDSDSDESTASDDSSKKKKLTKQQSVAMFWNKALTLMSSPQYELAMNIITVCNVFTVFVRAL